MRILLTGSTGFLGARLSQHLIRNGHEVVTFKCEILDLERFKWFMDGQQFDAAVHTVGLNDATCRQDPVRSYNVNVTGTHNLLASLDYVLCRKVIYLSTIHVYGYPASGTITEKTPVNPKSAYAISHFLAEESVLRYPGGTVLRLSNGFGAPADPARPSAWAVVVNAMCKQAVKNGEIILTIDEREERNFVTVTDICGAVHHLLCASPGGVFNVGSISSYRVASMAHRVADRHNAIFGCLPKVIINNRHQEYVGEPLDYRSDKLREHGFVPSENYNEEIDHLLMMSSKERNDACLSVVRS